MPNDRISDSLPQGFWNLSTTLTELNLSSNQIHGKLPDLSSTKYIYFSFDLSSNLLDGPIPLISLSQSKLILSKNRFSGSLPFLFESQSTSLSHFDLFSNRLSGELPSRWNQYQGLLDLNLAKNNSSGKIPNSLSYLPNVRLLRLHENDFLGEMPSLEGCKELKVVDLGRNGLSGRIPGTLAGAKLAQFTISTLKTQQVQRKLAFEPMQFICSPCLDFSHNNVSGTLPKCLNNITAMAYELTDNIILGFVQVVCKGIEIEFGQILKHPSVDISSNSVSGIIPENIKSLELVSLNLSRNNLIWRHSS